MNGDADDCSVGRAARVRNPSRSTTDPKENGAASRYRCSVVVAVPIQAGFSPFQSGLIPEGIPTPVLVLAVGAVLTLALLSGFGLLRRIDPPSEGDTESDLIGLFGVGHETADALREAGYESVEDLHGVSRDELTDVDGVGDSRASQIVAQVEREGSAAASDAGDGDPSRDDQASPDSGAVDAPSGSGDRTGGDTPADDEPSAGFPGLFPDADGETADASLSNRGEGPPETIPGAPSLSLSDSDFERIEPIGSGGNADVYRGSVSLDGDELRVAVKQPRLHGTLDADTVDRLLAEAETWSRLDDHEHIVDVVDYGGEPLPWIAMEFMDAGHLGDRSGELTTEKALWIAIATTKAVRHAHRRGVAHLDLKPENILFRSVEAGWDVPKVADWGLSKRLLDRSRGAEGLSPQYAAPEQFDSEFGPVDEITDIYQLGAVFYELFTGSPPFEGRSLEVTNGIQNETPTPPSAIADLPAELDDILLAALEKRKSERYETAVNLRNDLLALREQL
jgi:hypothetical protein